MTPELFSFSGIISYMSFFICAHIAIELFLQHVVKVKNSIFLRAFLFTILFVIFNPFAKKQTELEIEQKDNIVNADYRELVHSFDAYNTKNKIDKKVEVTTAWGLLTFADASLVQLKLKNIGQRVLSRPLELIHESTKIPTFALCYNDQVMVDWSLESQTETADTIELVYLSSYHGATFSKRFTIDRHIYKIDVGIDLVAKNSTDNAYISLLYPAPLAPGQIILDKSESSFVSDEQSAVLIGTTGKFEKMNPENIDQNVWESPALFGMDNRYSVHALIKDDGFAHNAFYLPRSANNGCMTAVLQSPIKNKQHSWRLSFYCGPKEVSSFEQVDKRLESTLGYWWVIAPLCKFFLRILNLLYHYLHNYGLAIIAFTFLIRLLFLPFTFGYDELEERKKRALHSKKLAYIRQKYKDDREALLREQGEFLRKEGLGFGSGMWITVLQLPLFITFSKILSYSVEIHGASMLWIPDLSAADPYYILPMLIFIIMMLRGILATPSNDGLRSFGISLIAGLCFSVFATYMSAGLVLYLLTSVVLELAQMFVTRTLKKYTDKKTTESCIA